ncbi:geraniol synthase, chloroplastic-like [Salvia hispanica]|uniref:geraniol synthase, chloroplastic-like n=1 Tax=Salvia hispanica TaxID=49212 RepID=UPI0020094754|nr:geraniol synthase, chloroplastic-like [Salvia hispanica]
MSWARSAISLILSQTLCHSQKASIPRQAASAAIPLRHSAVTYPIVNPQLQKPVILEERREYLIQKTIQKLQTSTEQLQLIDHLQRLGIGYHLEDMIDAILHLQRSAFSTEDDLFTTALRFRLLRQAGFHISTGVLLKFKGESEKFKESDMVGLLSLYEASNMGAQGEEILEEAMDFSKRSLLEGEDRVSEAVGQALEVPRHMRMARLEARRFIKEYGNGSDHDRDLLELAVLDYNHVQVQHQAELTQLKRWYTEGILVNVKTFHWDCVSKCFVYSVDYFHFPVLSRLKNWPLVIDDIFDTHGKMDELIQFTHAIQRWDLEAMETLPEYMKICYMALYNTTNDICYTVLKDTSRTVLPYLKATWIDMIEGFMVEAKWFNGGNAPNLEEYMENGVSTAGAYMALVHLFFLMGEGVTDQNASLLRRKPYPKVFSLAGRILRLWDDLGTAKEEQERGDLASGIPLFMKENNLATEEAARSGMLEEIFQLWKDLNGELINVNNALPLSIIKIALNMARASQVIHNHRQHTYSLSVDNYVQALFFTPLPSS